MKRASWETDQSPSEEYAEYRKGMAVSNLLPWKRDPFNMCLCGTEGRVRYKQHREGSRGRSKFLVFFRQLEPALELCPERLEPEPHSVGSSGVGGDLSWKTIPLGYLLPSL